MTDVNLQLNPMARPEYPKCTSNKRKPSELPVTTRSPNCAHHPVMALCRGRPPTTR